MLDFLRQLFTSDFMPHGHCFFWLPEILWLHVISDGLISIAYYSIPVTLLLFVRKRKDLQFNWIFVMFALFIFACGTTHIMDIWTMWHPTYRLQGVIKLFTAIASVTTAVATWMLIPKALRVPSPSQLHVEVEERRRVQSLLQETNGALEKKVDERTRELTDSHNSLQEKTEKLERFYNVTVNRELEMVKLKSEVDALLAELSRPPKYHPNGRPAAGS